MTTQQIHLFNGIGLVVLVVVAFFTRATARRIAGALAGGVAFGVVALGIIALGEEVGWWHMAITWEPYFLTLLLIDFALCAFIYLLTWRIARRFSWRGLAAVVIVAAVIGPPRDYWYMARFPEWGAYGPGVAPVLAIAATYVVMVVLEVTFEQVPDIPGDFDLDSDVDGADFLKWQRGESPDPLSSGDLADWETNYRTESDPLAATTSTVPEPWSGVLAMFGAAGLCLRQCRTTARIPTTHSRLRQVYKPPILNRRFGARVSNPTG